MTIADCGTGREWWEGLAGRYEGDGSEGESFVRKETSMTRTPFAGTATMEGPGYGFEAWLRRRRENPSDDAVYEESLRLMRGELAMDAAGVVGSGELGTSGADLSSNVSEGGASDDEVMAAYRAELDGSAARKRAEVNVRRAEQERRDWLVAEAKRRPTALARSDDDLRPQLQRHGY